MAFVRPVPFGQGMNQMEVISPLLIFVADFLFAADLVVVLRIENSNIGNSGQRTNFECANSEHTFAAKQIGEH